MNDLIGYFENDGAEAIEIALSEGEQVAINQEGEDPADIVASFADFVPGLTGGRTQGDTFEVRYQNRTHEVALDQCPADEDRIRRAIRDVLQPDYEIRALRSCLGTDTLAFVIDTPAVWQDIDTRFPRVACELFTPFSDDIGFDVAS